MQKRKLPIRCCIRYILAITLIYLAVMGALRFSVRWLRLPHFFILENFYMYSCTFIGHADCDKSIKEKLYCAIEELICENNVTTFYIGTHGYFDYYAYQVLLKLEKIYKIEILVVLSNLTSVPDYCKGSKMLFPDTVAKSPYRYAIIKRNGYMIKNSQFMVCYINYTFSNTYNFVKQAISKKLHIIDLGKFDLNKI